MTESEIKILLELNKSTGDNIAQVGKSLRELRILSQSHENRLSVLEGRLKGVGVALLVAGGVITALYQWGVIT
jgi:hypothetical protein